MKILLMKIIRVSLFAALMSASLAYVHTAVAAECKGKTSAACQASSSCSWVKGYKRADGVNVSSFCRAKSGKAVADKKQTAKKTAKKKTTVKKKAEAKKSSAKKSASKKAKKSSDKKTDKAKKQKQSSDKKKSKSKKKKSAKKSEN